jgi:hypothetical protein
MSRSTLKATLFLRAFGLRYIPLIFFCRPKVIDLTDARAEIQIPLARRTKNHQGGMYIGVYSVGADLAGGMLALQAARRHKPAASVIFKDMQAEYTKRADGDVHFVCEDGKAIEALIDEAERSGERQNMPVRVVASVPSLSPEPIARFVLTLSVKKSVKKAKTS